MPSACGGVAFSSSSSSSSAPPLKSDGPLCSLGPPWYVYRVIKSRMSHDEYSYSFLLLPKMKTATSTEQSTESS